MTPGPGPAVSAAGWGRSRWPGCKAPSCSHRCTPSGWATHTHTDTYHTTHTDTSLNIHMTHNTRDTIMIIIEHLLKRISLTVHQSSCRLTLIDMIINRHIKFNMLKT